MGLIIAGMTHQGWDVQLGLRCSGLEGELLPSRDRALHRRRHRVGADAVAGGAAGGVGGGDQAGDRRAILMSVARTPLADGKLDEAEFFLLHMREGHRSGADPLRALRFFLSAFLNAGYSCQEVLKLEVVQGKLMSRKTFDRWEASWVDVLGTEDARIWSLARDQRRHEVHLRGAKLVALSGLVRAAAQRLWRGGIMGTIVTGSTSPHTGPLLDEETALALAGLVLLTFGTIQHFQDERGRLEVVEGCTRYLNLLRAYVTDCHKNIEANASKPQKPPKS
jgi:hypothetical protein